MRAVWAVGLVLAAMGGVGVGLTAPNEWLAPISRPNWQEMPWPFAQDGWPTGRAFRCNSASCGGGLDVYIRAKIGLCNCSNGITGDAEVDAVSDVDLLAADFAPLAPGAAVAVGGMQGIARAYRLVEPNGVGRRAAGLALSNRCDLVAIASLGAWAGMPKGTEAISTLISRAEIASWLRNQMGKS